MQTECGKLVSTMATISKFIKKIYVVVFSFNVCAFSFFLQHVPSVEKALQRSVKLELLDGENLYMCPRFDFIINVT